MWDSLHRQNPCMRGPNFVHCSEVRRSFFHKSLYFFKHPRDSLSFFFLTECERKKTGKKNLLVFCKGLLTSQATRSISALPGLDASPLQGYPPALISPVPFILLGGERHCGSKVSCPRTQHCPRPGLEPGPLDPESS